MEGCGAGGDAQGAGVFKRAAGLSLLSLQRWKRPTGDWWIIKNRFDPSLRHGYEVGLCVPGHATPATLSHPSSSLI